MSDPFLVLDESPRPWLPPEALKEKFTRLSAERHPDKFRSVGGDALAEAERDFSALNTAYQTLREPRSRLLALLESTWGSKPSDVQRIPPGTMDLFVEIGQACREVDTLLAQRAQAKSALEKAAFMGQGLALLDTLQALDAKVDGRREALDRSCRELDEAWTQGQPNRDALEQLYRAYSYAARWKEQLQERLLALME
jgi:curved DNA-binding protein CbpA